jgi:hypothetical protein
MLAVSGPTEQKFGDVSRQTMRVVGIIAAWVVNTFYNYLHQEAVNLHTRGRVGSITDGYRYIVKEYLASFSTVEGYKRLVVSLHKYYVDNSGSSGFAFDEWTREVLEQFVPLDYKAIMSNEQQDTLLRNILISAVEQFSSEVICTKGLLDLLIMNHDEPSIAPRMKASMKAVLLNERQKIFNGIHKASTGGESTPHVTMRREILSLIEENVFLKSRAGKLTETLRKSLDGMKLRDKAISVLKSQVSTLERQLQSQPRDQDARLVVIPKTPAEEFKATISHIDPRPREARASGGSSAVNTLSNKSETTSLPSYMTSREAAKSDPNAESRSQWSAPSSNARFAEVPPIAVEVAAPLSQLEKAPERFEMADPEPEDDPAIVEELEPVVTGSDTLALNMDEFWEG